METIPTNLTMLVDGDIIRYEVGFAAEAGWRAITETDDIPPFDYVREMLLNRLRVIGEACHTDVPPRIFITEGPTFREDIAVSKPYKGTRVPNKCWHHNNLTVYLKDVLNAEVVNDIEADDAMAIAQTEYGGNGIIVSRDKDLRQVPGWFYSWELGRQPGFGPANITRDGTLSLHENRKKLVSTGLRSFYGQLLTGDVTDNIPGLSGCGPVAAYEHLDGKEVNDLFGIVSSLYADDEYLLEQGRLLWMVRRTDAKGDPILWELGMED